MTDGVSAWFEPEVATHHDEDVWDFTATELAFLAALRDRAAAWRVPWAPNEVTRPEDESSLLVYITLVDTRGHGTVVGDWAVHFHGTHVVAGRTDDDLLNVRDAPGRDWFRLAGTVDDLAQRCADWFEDVLSRPVFRVERQEPDGKVVTRWEFGDTEETAVGGVPPVPAPVRRGRVAYGSAPDAGRRAELNPHVARHQAFGAGTHHCLCRPPPSRGTPVRTPDVVPPHLLPASPVGTSPRTGTGTPSPFKLGALMRGL